MHLNICPPGAWLKHLKQNTCALVAEHKHIARCFVWPHAHGLASTQAMTMTSNNWRMIRRCAIAYKGLQTTRDRLQGLLRQNGDPNTTLPTTFNSDRFNLVRKAPNGAITKRCFLIVNLVCKGRRCPFSPMLCSRM